MANESNKWDLEPSHKEPVGNFDEEQDKGEDDADKVKPVSSSSVPRFPDWLRLEQNATLRRMRSKSNSVARLQRITLKVGITQIRNRFESKIDNISLLHDQVLGRNDQMLIQRVCARKAYELQFTVSSKASTCSVREWEAGAVDELLVKPLGLTLGSAILLTLLAGLATSTTYVSRFWKAHSEKELQYFGEYLDEEITWIKTEIAKK